MDFQAIQTSLLRLSGSPVGWALGLSLAFFLIALVAVRVSPEWAWRVASASKHFGKRLAILCAFAALAAVIFGYTPFNAWTSVVTHDSGWLWTSAVFTLLFCGTFAVALLPV